MNGPKFSLSAFMLATLLLLFMTLYIHQRFETQKIVKRIVAATEPFRQEIATTNLSIQKRQSQLKALRQKFETKYYVQLLSQKSSDGDTKIPIGIRRELSNFRNVRLKVERDKAKLTALQIELDKMMDAASK